MLLPSNPACVLVPMEARTLHDASPYRRMARRSFGDVAMASVDSVPQRVDALLDEVPGSAEDCLQFQIVHAGRLEVRHGARRVVVPEGTAMLYDASRPFGFVYPTRFVTSIVQVPARVLGLSGRRIEALSAGPISLATPAGSLLSLLARRTGRVSAAVDDVVADGFASALVDTITMVTDGAGLAPTLAEVQSVAVLHAARSHVQEHLADPDLQPAAVARALRVSVRRLHAAFADSGETFGQCVVRVRCEHGRRLLLELPTAPITMIAARSGFHSVDHFIRRFRELHGSPPAQWRRRASTGGPAGD
ncbi:helix-turn-helix transcriptional regulator [Rathayibacter oskolensis]|uniref:AraC family transcriptional regulator n=1 Tax=Rathayibacter oskolensis TaxID=1891671 RepID=UPI00265F5549|nr:AraC family transcriptional regulator [Rathayibacter oskolensis]WKK72510.1 helix-turn-helix transcriptional regulator [Rathayibacter oskolensis]